MTVSLSRADVEDFRAAICRRLGLRFDDSKLEFLEDVLRIRLQALGSPKAGDYLARPWAREETHALALTLTVAETYFFRNQEQFRALEESVVPHFVRSRDNPRELRVLSAACASGEEPYTLAIVLRECLPDSWSLSITGIDLNPTVLEKARAARYTEWSLRATAPELRERNFHREGADFILHDRVRKMVSFEQRNLIEDDPAFWRPHSLDVVFCRNVTMYFPMELTQGVMARIARALVPGGYLFLGHAETLRGISNDFHLRHTHDTFYYQRKSAGEHVAPLEREAHLDASAAAILPEVLEHDSSWVDAISQASARIAALATDSAARTRTDPRPETPATHPAAGAPASSRPGPALGAPASSRPVPALELGTALELLRAERFTEAMDVLAKLPRESQSEEEVQLLRAALLTNAGRLNDAEEICNQMLAADELNAGAHYLAALCREHAGDLKAAREHNQAAAYLNGTFAMPHLHLGLVAKRSGDIPAARRELDNARSLLRCEDASRILLFGGGFSREGLIELCNAELRALGE